MGKSAGTAIHAGVMRLPEWLKAKVQYLAKDGQRFNWKNNQLQLSQQAVSPVLLLSRLGYDEHHESFQMASRTELKKILRLRYGNTLCYHVISALKNGQRKVITFTPQPHLIDTCLKAKLVLPLSLLIGAGHQLGLHTISLPDGKFYQLNNDPLNFTSIPFNNLVVDDNRAMQLLGGHSNLPKYLWSDIKLSALWQQAIKLPVSYWLDCLNNLNKSNSSLNLVPFGVLSVALAIFYLFASSAVLSIQLEQRKQDVAHLNNEVTVVLDTRTKLQQAENLFTSLNLYQQAAVPAAGLWTIIALAQLNDVLLNVAESDGNQLRLQGNAASATDWLQLLLSSDVVTSADFSAPVRRDARGREQFSIVLKLAPLPDEIKQEGAI